MRGEPVYAVPKHEPAKVARGRAERHAAKVVKSVRQQCVERDGYCRYATEWLRRDLGVTQRGSCVLCVGLSEWAHLGESKRFKTRGKPPEERHTTAGSLMLCAFHHHAYDDGELRILGANANQTLRFRWKKAP